MSGSDVLKHARVHERAVSLLERFFAADGEQGRRTVFNLAFGNSERDPRGTIVYTGSTLEFADHAVGRLLAFGCADRGRHCLSLLLGTMAEVRGRQGDPDYSDLPPLIDALCLLPTRGEELAYLDRLLSEIDEKARLYAPLRGIADIESAAKTVALLRPWSDDEDIALLLHRPQPRKGSTERRPREYDDILVAFGDVQQAALLGAPGAGKSTTLRKLAADLARRARTDPEAPLPVLASLGSWRGDEDLAGFLEDRVPEVGWAVPALSERGRLVLLLDGLNEVPTAKRKAKAAAVAAFKGLLARATPFIVSCRRDDYAGDLDLGLDTLSLEPLSPQRVRQVLHHWLPEDAEGVAPGSAERLFWQLAGDERLAGVLAKWLAAGATEDAFWSVSDPRDDEKAYAGTDNADDEIWRRCIPNPRSLLRLASNPFMLTMLYQVWVFEGELPRNRGDLFARFIDRLLRREGLLARDPSGHWVRTVEGERLLEGLCQVAWSMQGERVDRDREEADDFGVPGVLAREDVLEALVGEPPVDQSEDLGMQTVIRRSDVLAVLGDASPLKKAEDASLLEGTEEIRFRHQLLQEYFTATAMQRRIAAGELSADQLWPAERWWERSGWEESAVLLAGLHAQDCTPVIRWLMDAQPEVAAQCIPESGAEIADRDALFRELHAAWRPRLTDATREPRPEARAAVGRALGRLGLDDRKGVGVTDEGLPDIDWVEIPGSEFVYQNGERRRIETFHIARFPVTNAQFRAFVDAPDGYASDLWWKGLSVDEPDRHPDQPRWDIANHPREMVSWFEAMAFCAWLSYKTGLDIQLPTEWQWERAARGTDGRIYPWGPEYRSGLANINETLRDVGPHYLERTSAVGIYPQGSSPEGVLDLSGNVWEWCLNEYSNPDQTRLGGEESRVVRGGSWDNDRDFARADDRYDFHPNYRDDDFGFRVVCASPIPAER